MSSNERWKNRPDGSTWGDYGPNDQLGRLNEITAEKVQQGVAEVRTGQTFCLSMPLDHPGGNALNPRRFPPQLRPTLRNDKPNWGYRAEWDHPGMQDVINDDMVLLHLQYSTQWDTLAHVGALFDADGDGVAEPVFYNGYRLSHEILGPTEGKDAGAVPGTMVPAVGTSASNALGVENMARKCIQGRAVMVDLEAHFGRAKKPVDYDDLMRIFAADGIKVLPGDMVCFRTGFDEVIFEARKKPTPEWLHGHCCGLDGRDDRLLRWISDSKVSALIADNYAVEMYDAPPKPGQCVMLPLHHHALFKLGVNLGEIWRLSELANWLRKNNRTSFLLTAPPLNLPGAVGSPANAIATV